uniref:Uncharacterized protein n=1 Tax=Oryza rufipogon TaxID=4529 RepID=A0A0E0PZH5_ORYRU
MFMGYATLLLWAEYNIPKLVASKHQGCCLDNVSTTGTADLPCPDHCKELLRIVITSFLEGCNM